MTVHLPAINTSCFRCFSCGKGQILKSFGVGVGILADDKAHMCWCLGVLVHEMTKLSDVSKRSPWDPLAEVPSKDTYTTIKSLTAVSMTNNNLH